MYLMTVAAEAVIMLIPETRARFSPVLIPTPGGTIFIQLALSLLINIYATFIIALKAWCVHFDRILGKHLVDCALIDDPMRAYIQEIPQVADENRDRCQNP
jgi:hypothetical protein